MMRWLFLLCAGGLACYVAGRWRAFAALIVLAATCKLVPAAFLLLLLVPTRDRPARKGLLAVSVLALGALVLVPLAIGPAAHWRGFFGAPIAGAFPVGEANPSVFALLVLLGAALASQDAHPLSDDYINYINSLNSTWKV